MKKSKKKMRNRRRKSESAMIVWTIERFLGRGLDLGWAGVPEMGAGSVLLLSHDTRSNKDLDQSIQQT